MTLARAATGLIAVLVALVALAPLPASAAPLVYHTSLVCADVDLSGPSVVQNAGGGIATLELGGPNVLVKFKANGLPASSPAACAVLCVVNGALDLFDFEIFSPCATTGPSGKLTFSGSVPFAAFEGGCLVPVMALLVESAVGFPVVCAPGFGTFDPFVP